LDAGALCLLGFSREQRGRERAVLTLFGITQQDKSRGNQVAKRLFLGALGVDRRKGEVVTQVDAAGRALGFEPIWGVAELEGEHSREPSNEWRRRELQEKPSGASVPGDCPSSSATSIQELASSFLVILREA